LRTKTLLGVLLKRFGERRAYPVEDQCWRGLGRQPVRPDRLLRRKRLQASDEGVARVDTTLAGSDFSRQSGGVSQHLGEVRRSDEMRERFAILDARLRLPDFSQSRPYAFDIRIRLGDCV